DVTGVTPDYSTTDYTLNNSSPLIGTGYSAYVINAQGTNVDSLVWTSGAKRQLLAKDLAGNARPSPSGSAPDIGAYENALGTPLVDNTAPTISSIASTTNDGTYKFGDAINVKVTFSEAVTLSTGNLNIILETGDTDQTVSISSISSSTTATATYTVQAGDESADLTVKSIGLSFYAATIADGSGNVMTDFTIPTAANLADNAALVIDGVVPAATIGFTAEAGDKQVVLIWTANSESDLASYKVYGSTSADPTTLLETVTAGTETYTHTGLTNGTTYYYGISALDNAGNESVKTADVTDIPMNTLTVKKDDTGDYATIQAAIDAAGDWTKIVVSDGTYVEAIDFKDKHLTIVSENGRDKTIIDGNQAFHVVDMRYGSKTMVLDGFTVQNGRGGNESEGYDCATNWLDCHGGGITIEGSSTLKNLIIQNNFASHGGGLFNRGEISIKNVIMRNNTGWTGGAAIETWSYLDVENMLVYNNFGGTAILQTGTAGNRTAAIYKNVTIVNNQSYGMNIGAENVILFNSIIYGNQQQEEGGGAQIKTEYSERTYNLIIFNSLIENGLNGIDNKTGFLSTNWDVSNMSFEPQFVDTSAANFKLKDASRSIGKGAASVTINNVTYTAPTVDMDNNTRPNPAGSNPDLGAYENVYGAPYDPNPPAKPTDLTATAGVGKITLNWSANTENDLLGYKIYGGTGASPTTVLDTLNYNITTFTHTDLDTNVTYYYRLSALDYSGNESAKTADVSATTVVPDVAPPATPSGLTATAGAGLVTLNWTANTESDLAKYHIYRSSDDITFTKLGTEPTTTTYINRNLTSGATYYFRITAVDNSGNESPQTASVSAVPTKQYTVKKDGTGDFTTIQAAIDAAKSGETVLVYAGTYNENITIDSKGIAFISNSGSDSTIIDGGSNGTVLSVKNVFDSVDTIAVVTGFTLRNGSAVQSPDNEGGGLFFQSGSLVFNDLIVENNYASGQGGGIYVSGAEKSIFNNCIIRNNYGGNGAGIMLAVSQGELHNVLVYGNEGSDRGTAVWFSGFANDKTHVLNHVTITGNTNKGEKIYTSGLYLGGGNAVILNSIIEGNEYGSIAIVNNDENETITISNTVLKRGTTDGTGDIQINIIGTNNHTLNQSNVYDYDPAFIDAENSNYTLSKHSKLIGAGLSSLDISWGTKPFTQTITPLSIDLAGNTRPNPSGSAPDMGAYENKYSSRFPKANTISDGLSDTLEMDFSNSTSTLSAHWKKFDDNGTVIYEYAIGTTSLNNTVDWTTNSTDTSITVSGLSLVNNETYYFSVRGTDNDGQLSDIATTDGVLIDNEKPVISSVSESPGVFINHSIRYENTGCYGCSGSNIIDNNLSNEILGDMTVEFWIKHGQTTEGNLHPIEAKQFFIMFAGMQDGAEAGIQLNFTDPSGNNPASGGASLPFNEWTHFSITRDNSMLYKIYMNGVFKTQHQGAAEQKILTEQFGFGSHVGAFGKGNLDEVRFWNYERSEQDIQSNLYKEVSGSETGLVGYWNFNSVWVDTIYDLSGNNNHALKPSGPGVSQYSNDTWQTDFSNSLVNVDWYGPGKAAKIITMATDNGSISKYEYSIGTSAGSDDAVSWFQGDSNVISIDLSAFSESIHYYANARVTDAVGNVSEVVSSDGFQMDLTAPVAGTVSNGDNYQSDTTLVTLTWSGFSDTPSGLSHYEYSLGTQPGAGNIVARTNVGLAESIALSSLDLDNNQTYYGTVYALDLVGNEAFASSEGVTIDRTGPSVGTIVDGSGEDIDWLNVNTSVSANWISFDDVNGIAKYEVALGSVAKGSDIAGWADIGTDTSHTFNDLSLSDNTQYFFSVRATDGLGNLSEVASSNGFMVDITAPGISSVSVPTTNTLSIFDNVSIEMTLSEPVLAGNVSFSSAQGDNVGFTQNIEEQTNIIITLAAPFTGGDEFTLTVNGLTDRASNVTDNLEYIYNVALLADYDVDGTIGVNDMNSFITGWNAKDTQYELGPVVGTSPYLKPALDGIYNSRDGMSFYRMWHWDHDQSGKLIAKMLDKAGENLMVSFDNENLVFNPPVGTQAAEIIINYPQAEIQILPKNQNVTDNMAMALTKVDTISGKLLSHQMIIENQAISFELQHYQKKDVTITISYQYISKDNEIIGSGNTDLILKPVPQEFALHQNYPNPFNPVTTINYDLPQQTHVNLMIYDILGREVVKLISEEIPAGYQSVIWNTRNSFGTPVSAGIYFYQIQTKGFVKTKKMVLLK
ncbi:MAG: T9SS type A sorting domain-containing protein, partial [Candidatus Marinimicrobia bacterium]|nr:T9SS type A sorting domain-containing protein [Candidatus Neomarinimicrobiota bacterium]